MLARLRGIRWFFNPAGVDREQLGGRVMITGQIGWVEANEAEDQNLAKEYPKGHHRTLREAGILIRPYEQTDREAICRICCDTGFLGHPIEPLFLDREMVADLFTKPYLQYEP